MAQSLKGLDQHDSKSLDCFEQTVIRDTSVKDSGHEDSKEVRSVVEKSYIPLYNA